MKSKQLSQISRSKELVVIGWKDSMSLAYDLMTSNSTRHIPVVDDTGSIVGMISDRDAKKAMIFDQADWTSGKTPQPEFDPNALTRDYMSWPVVTINESSSVREAAKLMLEKKISALILLRSDIAVAIVTTDDLLRSIVRDTETSTLDLQTTIGNAIYNSPLGTFVQSLSNVGI